MWCIWGCERLKGVFGFRFVLFSVPFFGKFGVMLRLTNLYFSSVVSIWSRDDTCHTTGLLTLPVIQKPGYPSLMMVREAEA